MSPLQHHIMSSSSFSIVQQSLGAMGSSGAVAAAELAAYRRTAALAASRPLSRGDILASTVPGSGPIGNLAQPGQSSDPFISELYTEAAQACFVERNPEKCSIINQQIASAQAAVTCPGGPQEIALNSRKEQGSLWRWLYQPTFVSAIKPATEDTAAVSVSLGAIQRSN